MGNFFTSSQIYNDKDLNKQQFIDKFCKAMADSGYVVCDSEESEMSYILRFAEKSKWVAIASESYGEGGQIAQADAGRIAKMLGTYCMNTEVIDSDCAAMSLYSNDGKEADMLLMGRYDDYFGDDTPAPNKKIWTQFLSDGSTWEQFTEILSGNYVFVEDGLAQLAPVIGMDSGNLLFSAEDDVDDESAVFIDFKKAGNKKKLTINSAFKQVIGEALKPYGFKVIKGRQPYIVRVINNEILHIISFYSKDPDYPFDKAITIVCGIATVYRKRISLDLTPKQNRIWLKCYNNLGIPFMEKNGMTKKRLPSKSCYNSNDPESMIATLKIGAENLIKYVLPVFDEVKDIDSALDFAEDFGQPCYSQMCTEVCNTYSDEDESFLNFLSEKVLSKHYRFLDNYFNDPNFHEWVLNEIEKRKKENTEILRKLGLLSDDESKENSLTPSEKLTLNAAFKQIFGEALEPLGFHVVKSRYPYLVRVINDEILHVISIRTEQAEYPEDKAFSILGGIATVYRRSIDLNANPMENYHWLRNNVTSFYLYSIDTEPDRRLASIMSQFNYFSEVPKSLPCVMKEALEYTKKYMISYMDGIDSLEKCINHLIKAKLISTAPLNSGLQFTSGTSYDDGLIYLKTNYKHHKELWEEIIEKKEDISDEQYNRIKEFYKFFTDDEYIQGLANELERRKQKNLLALENIGIDI